jgi:hypothetical protein
MKPFLAKEEQAKGNIVEGEFTEVTEVRDPDEDILGKVQ